MWEREREKVEDGGKWSLFCSYQNCLGASTKQPPEIIPKYGCE
jgi:hypothetical protein